MRIYDAMQLSDAWKALSGNAVKALLHVAAYEHPKNSPNGALFMSWVHLAEGIGVSRNTAGRALLELVEKGFLRITEEGHFDRKGGPAHSYRLTWRGALGKAPTNDWRDWKPPLEIKDGSRINTHAGANIKPPSDYQAATGAIFTPTPCGNPQIPVVGVSPDITLHTVTTTEGFSEGHETPLINPPNTGGPNRGASILPFREPIAPTCERCGEPFLNAGRGGQRKRFCSEPCRKKAEAARLRERAKAGGQG